MVELKTWMPLRVKRFSAQTLPGKISSSKKRVQRTKRQPRIRCARPRSSSSPSKNTKARRRTALRRKNTSRARRRAQCAGGGPLLQEDRGPLNRVDVVDLSFFGQQFFPNRAFMKTDRRASEQFADEIKKQPRGRDSTS